MKKYEQQISKRETKKFFFECKNFSSLNLYRKIIIAIHFPDRWLQSGALAMLVVSVSLTAAHAESIVNDARCIVNNGNIYEKNGEFLKAITEYKKLVEDENAELKDRIAASNKIGGIFFINLKNDTEAKKYFEFAKDLKLQEKQNNDPNVLFEKNIRQGDILISKKDYAAAEALYRKYLERNDITSKQRAQMLMKTGNLLWIQKKYPESLVEYSKASAEGGITESIAMVWIAKVNICLKDYDDAQTVCRKIIEADRFNAAQKLEGYAAMAELKMAQKDFSGSHKMLDEAAEKVTDARDAASIIARKRGMVYEAEGKYKDAVEAYQKAADDESLDKSLRASAYSSIASVAFRKLGDRKTALECLDKAEALKATWGYDSNLHKQLKIK